VALKSVIDIDLNSSEFECFSAMFAAYQEQLAKMPDAWKKVSKAQSVAGNGLEKMVTALKEQNTQVSTLATSERLWTSIGSMSSLVLRNVLSIGTTMLKFGAGLGLGVIGGGLYGIDRMAEKIAADRRQAMGLNMSIGGMQSWQTNMSRLVDPDAYLGNVAGMETDITQQQAWWSLMGGRPMTRNTGADAAALLQAERAKLQSVPMGLMGSTARAYGFDDDPASMLRLRNMAPAEFNKLLTDTAKDQNGGMSVADKTAKAWTDLTTQISRAGTTIEDTFVKKLVPLAGPLGKLSQAVTKDVEAFTQTKLFTDSVKAAASGVDKFAAKIGDKSFMTGMDTFAKDIEGIAGVFEKLLAPFRASHAALSWSAKKLHDLNQAGGKVAWDLGTGIQGGAASALGGLESFFGLRSPAGVMARQYANSSLSAAQLRSMDLGGVSAGNISATAPQIHSHLHAAGMPTHLTIMNMTGGSAIVAINGLVGAN
jgi:hypothetical protein